MSENDKDWLLYVRSQYLQKFGLSWWPFLHEYLPGLPKLVPLVILEAIKNKSFRYILTCIQVSALKIITLLFCQGNVSVKLFWLWTDLSTYTFIPRALSLMWRLCHFDRASNVEYLLFFSTAAKFYNLRHLQGIKIISWVRHSCKSDLYFSQQRRI